jgi:acetolactate decarboxylase
MPKIVADIPNSLNWVLNDEIARGGSDGSSIVTAALAQYLKTHVHTLFQVSTSGALVAGVYAGAVSAQEVLEHVDFGLGTFANLDGEMVVLDGHVYQVQGTGRVLEAPRTAQAPFAVVTKFASNMDLEIGAITIFSDLQRRCNSLRTSDNIFYALRLDGRSGIQTRAVNRLEAGTGLVNAAKAQTEFSFTGASGTLVGSWSLGFSSAFGVAGYHFHFLSNDRKEGGDLLECESGPLRFMMEALTDFHLALPKTESFLKADLSKNTAMNSLTRNRPSTGIHSKLGQLSTSAISSRKRPPSPLPSH